MAFIRLEGMEYVGCEPAPRGEVLIVADKHQAAVFWSRECGYFKFN